MQRHDLDITAQPTETAATEPRTGRETCADAPWGEVRPFALFAGLHPASLAVAGEDASDVASARRIDNSGEDQRGTDRE